MVPFLAKQDEMMETIRPDHEVAKDGFSGRKAGEPDVDPARREFLGKCGRFAMMVPPMLVTLATASIDNPALAQSGAPSKSSGGSGQRRQWYWYLLRALGVV